MFDQKHFIVIDPHNGEAARGIVWYPGGLVAPEAYIESLLPTAESTQSVIIIVRMPSNLAVLAPDRGLAVFSEFPEIKEWYLAGHSLGGAMAARVVKDNPDSFSGLLLLASYPAESDSTDSVPIPVLSLYAEFDGLATPEKIEASRSLLPASTQFIMIQGGNHAQFGSYGIQKRDGEATISPFEQWLEMSRKIGEFISRNP